jgi:hypothetical protein
VTATPQTAGKWLDGLLAGLDQVADPVTRAVLIGQAASSCALMVRSLEPRPGRAAGAGRAAIAELAGCLRAISATETGTLTAFPPTGPQLLWARLNGQTSRPARAALIGDLAGHAAYPLCADALRALARMEAAA